MPMWMKVLGRSRRAVKFIGVLWLSLAFTVSGVIAAPEKSPPSPSPPPQAAEIIFSGKFFCSLKRPVYLAFPGLITALRVRAGQWVEAGEILARYRLTPEASVQIHRRLSPSPIKELEIQLAGVEKDLAELESKHKGLKQLARQNLASAQSLAQIERERRLLIRQRQAIQKNLEAERHLAKQERALLKTQLGKALNPGQTPKEGILTAPISGHVVWVHPGLRVGAELKTKEPVFQIGVMDPMLIRARVHEIEAMQLGLGDRAEVTVESLGGQKFEAQVSRLPWVSITQAPERPSYYEVEFKVPNPDLVLKEGLKGRIVLRKPQ